MGGTFSKRKRGWKKPEPKGWQNSKRATQPIIVVTPNNTTVNNGESRTETPEAFELEEPLKIPMKLLPLEEGDVINDEARDRVYEVPLRPKTLRLTVPESGMGTSTTDIEIGATIEPRPYVSDAKHDDHPSNVEGSETGSSEYGSGSEESEIAVKVKPKPKDNNGNPNIRKPIVNAKSSSKPSTSKIPVRKILEKPIQKQPLPPVRKLPSSATSKVQRPVSKKPKSPKRKRTPNTSRPSSKESKPAFVVGSGPLPQKLKQYKLLEVSFQTKVASPHCGDENDNCGQNGLLNKWLDNLSSCPSDEDGGSEIQKQNDWNPDTKIDGHKVCKFRPRPIKQQEGNVEKTATTATTTAIEHRQIHKSMSWCQDQKSKEFFVFLSPVKIFERSSTLSHSSYPGNSSGVCNYYGFPN